MILVENDQIRKYQFEGYTIKHSSFHQMWEVVKKKPQRRGRVCGYQTIPFKGSCRSMGE